MVQVCTVRTHKMWTSNPRMQCYVNVARQEWKVGNFWQPRATLWDDGTLLREQCLATRVRLKLISRVGVASLVVCARQAPSHKQGTKSVPTPGPY